MLEDQAAASRARAHDDGLPGAQVRLGDERERLGRECRSDNDDQLGTLHYRACVVAGIPDRGKTGQHAGGVDPPGRGDRLAVHGEALGAVEADLIPVLRVVEGDRTAAVA